MLSSCVRLISWQVPVSTIQDAETGGAKVALNQLISLTDWRGHDFEMGYE